MFECAKTLLPHHLAALWFADIAGYSERAAEDERGALQLVEILQALSRSTVHGYEGRVVKFLRRCGSGGISEYRNGCARGNRLSQNFAEAVSYKTGRAHDLRIGVHLAMLP